MQSADSKFVSKIVLLLSFSVGLLFAAPNYAQAEYEHSNALSWSLNYQLVENQSRGAYRSKAEVMRIVKRKYDARVLKISLLEQRGIYRVRLLMPNGKIRNISVSAKR